MTSNHLALTAKLGKEVASRMPLTLDCTTVIETKYTCSYNTDYTMLHETCLSDKQAIPKTKVAESRQEWL